jgi:hypothetical protein
MAQIETQIAEHEKTMADKGYTYPTGYIREETHRNIRDSLNYKGAAEGARNLLSDYKKQLTDILGPAFWTKELTQWYDQWFGRLNQRAVTGEYDQDLFTDFEGFLKELENRAKTFYQQSPEYNRNVSGY